VIKQMRRKVAQWLLPLRIPEMVDGTGALPDREIPVGTGSRHTDPNGAPRFAKILPPGVVAPFDAAARFGRPVFLTPWDGTDPVGQPELRSLFAELARPDLVGYAFAGASAASGGSACSRSEQSGRSDLFRRLWLILQPPLLERLNKPGAFPDGRHPYPFQVEGIRWLLDHPEALLADEMGLGKTMQAILAMRALFHRGELNRALVVAPASVGATWDRELALCAGDLIAVRVQGTPAQRGGQWRSGAEVYVVSYESLVRDIRQLSPVASIPFDLCIADEAQKIKNATTANARAICAVSAECGYRWALTGTPLENAVSDAVSIFRFISPSLRLDPQSPSAQMVRRAIAPQVLRRTKAQVEIQFPELRHDVHWLDLGPGQRRAYLDAEQAGVDELRELGVYATRIHVLGLITRLKLICNHDEQSAESCKVDFLLDCLDEISAHGEKALVFSQYPHKSLAKVADRLQRFKPLRFDSSISSRHRETTIEQFQQQDDNDILLMGIHAGGTGITLTRANHVFHFDHWWNPATVDQGSARVHRIGQKRPVFIHSLYIRDTIEERIDEILNRKRRLFHDVFGALEDNVVINRLSDEELFGLFGLEPPNVGERPDSAPEAQP